MMRCAYIYPDGWRLDGPCRLLGEERYHWNIEDTLGDSVLFRSLLTFAFHVASVISGGVFLHDHMPCLDVFGLSFEHKFPLEPKASTVPLDVCIHTRSFPGTARTCAP